MNGIDAKEFMIKVGDYVEPDGWKIGNELLEGCPARENFAGSYFRIRCCKHADLIIEVNIKITGRKIRHHAYDRYGKAIAKTRCRLEYVQYGEPSIFDYGWLYLKNTDAKI